jgi:hypothetical protein
MRLPANQPLYSKGRIHLRGLAFRSLPICPSLALIIQLKLDAEVKNLFYKQYVESLKFRYGQKMGVHY